MKLYQNPIRENEMATEGMTSVVEYQNPRRRHRRRRNPYEMMENPSTGTPYQNPDFKDQLWNGSDITQNVSLIDVAEGGFGFLVNHWVVNMSGLQGWGAVAVAGITPFLTGGLASVMSPRAGSVLFLSGMIEFVLRLAGNVELFGLGLKQVGNDWVVKTFPVTAIPGFPTAQVYAPIAPVASIPSANAYSTYNMSGMGSSRPTVGKKIVV